MLRFCFSGKISYTGEAERESSGTVITAFGPSSTNLNLTKILFESSDPASMFKSLKERELVKSDH